MPKVVYAPMLVPAACSGCGWVYTQRDWRQLARVPNGHPLTARRCGHCGTKVVHQDSADTRKKQNQNTLPVPPHAARPRTPSRTFTAPAPAPSSSEMRACAPAPPSGAESADVVAGADETTSRSPTRPKQLG